VECSALDNLEYTILNTLILLFHIRIWKHYGSHWSVHSIDVAVLLVIILKYEQRTKTPGWLNVKSYICDSVCKYLMSMCSFQKAIAIPFSCHLYFTLLDVCSIKMIFGFWFLLPPRSSLLEYHSKKLKKAKLHNDSNVPILLLWGHMATLSLYAISQHYQLLNTLASFHSLSWPVSVATLQWTVGTIVSWWMAASSQLLHLNISTIITKFIGIWQAL